MSDDFNRMTQSDSSLQLFTLSDISWGAHQPDFQAKAASLFAHHISLLPPPLCSAGTVQQQLAQVQARKMTPQQLVQYRQQAILKHQAQQQQQQLRQARSITALQVGGGPRGGTGICNMM